MNELFAVDNKIDKPTFNILHSDFLFLDKLSKNSKVIILV